MPLEGREQRPEVLAALLEVAVLVERRTRRGEQHDLARARRLARRRERALEIAAAVSYTHLTLPTTPYV